MDFTSSGCSREFTRSVAPNCRANSSFAGEMSTTTILAAPASAAAWITLSPTPPAPNTTTTEPGSTLAVLVTAPNPVMTLQPTRAARSRGTVGSIFTTLSTCSVAYSDMTPQPQKTFSEL